MNAEERFDLECAERVRENARDPELRSLAQAWLEKGLARKYMYNFTWLGRPIIQHPQDVLAIQELMWRVQPDLVIETGVALGGSLVLSASMLALLDLCRQSPAETGRLALGIEIDLRSHNRAALAAHPLARYFRVLDGSSVEPAIVDRVRAIAADHRTIMVLLDSHHTRDHVLAELEAYAPLVSVGSYCLVFDTFIEGLSPSDFVDRPWKPGDSPRTAVDAFLAGHPEFEATSDLEDKLLVTSAPGGFLRRTR